MRAARPKRMTALSLCQYRVCELEWAPWRGQDGFPQLTGEPGFQRMKAYDTTPNPQHRIQASDRAGSADRGARTLVGKQSLELEFLKRALRDAPHRRSVPTSVISGPQDFPSPKDVGCDANRPLELL